MKKLAMIGAMAIAAVCVAVGLAPAASAYPDQSCNVTVDAQKVDSGAKLEVTATSQQFSTPRAVAADAVDWTATFNGVTKTAHASTFHTTFAVPTVTTKTVLVLHVSAVMSDATTCNKSLDITVLPGHTNVNPPGHLPNTGGPSFYLLLAGLVLVVAGGGAIYTSRKRHGAHTV